MGNGVQIGMHALSSPFASPSIGLRFDEIRERMRLVVRIHRVRLGLEAGVRRVAAGWGLSRAPGEEPDWDRLELRRRPEASELELFLLQEGWVVGHAKARKSGAAVWYPEPAVGAPWAQELLIGAVEEWTREG